MTLSKFVTWFSDPVAFATPDTPDTPDEETPNLFHYNGTEWEPVLVKHWDGSEWVSVTVKAWDGSGWLE